MKDEKTTKDPRPPLSTPEQDRAGPPPLPRGLPPLLRRHKMEAGGPGRLTGPCGGGWGERDNPLLPEVRRKRRQHEGNGGEKPRGPSLSPGKGQRNRHHPRGTGPPPPPAPVLTSRRRGGVAFPGPARRRSPWERRRHEPYGDGRGAGPAPRGRPSNGSRPDLRLPLRYRARPGGTTSSPRPLQHPGLGGREPVRPGPTPFRGGVEGGPAGPWVGS